MHKEQATAEQGIWKHRGIVLLNLVKITIGASLLVSAYVRGPNYELTNHPSWMTVGDLVSEMRILDM
ncbi:MAG: hypothetical protein KTR33_14460 [Gammaproteobacteria bacterium]|nr:hypothetical protein [Gammaproteobacteria bacterium]